MIDNDQIGDVRGRDVHGVDGGSIGTASEVHLDYRTGRTEWVRVRTGWLGLTETFVPLTGATVSNDRITVPFTRRQVADAPAASADGDLGQAEVDRLLAHYGLDPLTTSAAREGFAGR